jgi:hypothetical protein
MPLYATPLKLTTTMASITSTSGTSPTAILAARIPANVVAVGQVFEVTLFGVSSTNGANLGFVVYAGANGTTSDTAVWTSQTATGQVQYGRGGLDGMLTVRAVGATGTVQCEAVGFAYINGPGYYMPLPAVGSAVTTATIATTAAWYITLAATCSTGTFAVQQAMVTAV